MKTGPRSAQLLVIGAALALAACDPRQPQATDSAPAASSSQPAQSEMAATVSAQGYGGVRVGMTPAEASAALGVPLTTANPGEEDEPCYYITPGGSFDGPVAFMVTEGTVARVDVDKPGVATAARAEVGDSEASVLALYPDAGVSPHKYGDEGDHYVEVREGDGALILETWDGKVQSIRAGRLPEARYIEGCS